MDVGSQVEVRTQTIWLDDEGIVRARLKPGIHIGLGDAQEAVRAIGELAQGRRSRVLVDMREILSMDREARMYFAGEETAKVESAVAIFIRSPLSRAIGNFFMGLNKPLFPTCLFTSEEEALAWLKSSTP
ncbi:STAS/SEC14 domain-containing protein [Archangium gephyra]|uniref:STAS/SEC14 domain-containing protein n=1 Tax=Archangium gephyra TaxID=48 RepID=UPI0035D52AED